MRKVRVKKLREKFEDSIKHLRGNDRIRGSFVYNKGWKRFKKDYIHNV